MRDGTTSEDRATQLLICEALSLPIVAKREECTSNVLGYCGHWDLVSSVENLLISLSLFIVIALAV